jgi:TrmH family RNA methyltransferase
VRRLRRLLQKRSARWAERAFVAEGVELVRTALQAGVAVESLYVGAGGGSAPDVAAVAAQALAAGARVFDLAPGVLERAADTVTPQPVLAVMPMAAVTIDELAAARLLVVCVDVQDPGNAGTVLRSADAAGADGVVLCGATVDPYNPKTVRASAGSIFHVPIAVTGPYPGAAGWLADHGIRRLGAVVEGGEDYTAVDWRRPTALILGNEAMGLAPADRRHLDATVGIPMAGRAQSLNVGVACAVLCFEALRQRRGPGRW